MAEMPQSLRRRFHEALDEIDSSIIRMFALVTESVSAATAALLDGDHETAAALKDRDRELDDLNHEVELIVQQQLMREAPVASEMRYLVAALRIAPELERSGDLAVHIGRRVLRGVTPELTPSIRGLIAEMGSGCVSLWRASADAWVDRDGSAHVDIDAADDEIDELHQRFTEELLRGAVPLPAALQLSLVGRFYERLGDHAVHISERVRYAALGD